MKHKLPESIKIELIDNKITNTDSILYNLMSINDYDMLKEYYEFLINNIDINIYENLNIIVSAIKSRLNVLEQKINVKKELEKIQKENPKLKNLSIIESPKEKNDTLKDLYYLKYKDKNGETHLLEIDNIEKFINLLNSLGNTMDSEYFFNTLKTRYFNELQSYSLGNDKIDLFTYENSYLLKDKAAFLIEKEALDDYINLNHPNIVPKISIDSNSERLYYVGDIIIKFHNDNNTRKMEIINESVNENSKIDKTNSETTKIEGSSEIKRSDINNIEVDTLEAKKIIHKFVTSKDLSKDELIKLYSYVTDLLDTLETGFEIENRDEMLLTQVIDELYNKECNNIEKEILNRYNNYTINNSSSLEKADKTLKLTSETPLVIDDKGIIYSITIIAVSVIIGAVITALLLVK